MNEIPEAIQQSLICGSSKLAWVVLADGRVTEFGGASQHHGLSQLVVGEPLPPDLPWSSFVVDELAGSTPVEMRALRLDPDLAAHSDVLGWTEGSATYVLFFDSTRAVELIDASLSRLNGDDLLRDRLAGAERMRRVERRARGEAFAALGYELLEEGPDGAFRPPGEPAEWLVSLCGWEAGEPRVVDPGDPVDYLSGFLGDAVEFLAEARSGPNGPVVRTLSSGVWTEVLPESLEVGAPQRDVSFQAHALALSDGRGVVVVEYKDQSLAAMQVSLQRQRDAELSYEGLSHEMQVKDVLLHCIVHDLRGPLSGLLGAFSLLKKGSLDAEDTAETIELGLRQAKRQDEMIRHVLDVFAAEYEALRQFDDDPATAPDAVAITRETAQRQWAAFRAKGVEIEVTGSRGDLRVVGRADRLERVIANLIGNALRHAPAGSTVEVDVQARGSEEVVVSVLDRGPGVPGEIRERLFRRFVQGGSAGAAGLGLFYVRMTVERWGGTAEYEPREGGGAAFRVILRRVSVSS
ncbi:MAG: signal transduction histidine kinase [Paracoccaceae bacterium]